MRELLQVILPFNPSLFSALPQHKGPRKTPSITSFLTRKRTPLPLPSNPFVKKPHSEVVKSSITFALILNNGVRWVLNVGWSGYGSRLGEKKNTTDARCIRHQIKAQTNLSVLPLVHSSLPPPPTSPLSSFASGWESGQGIWASKEQIHTCPDPQTLACFIYGWGLTIIFTLRGGFLCSLMSMVYFV